MGFNYSRDERFRLIEDYWDADGPEGWAKVERDFREMKQLGANVGRLHLQFAKFMDAPGKPNEANLARIGKVAALAEDLGLYLDITSLGTYRAADVPAWYRNSPEKEHWAAQAQFWEAIARECAGHPGIFAYNLMNEPLATASKRPAGEWTHPAEIEGLRYVEYIDLNPAGRKPPDIARAWLHQMTQAIRKYDQRHLITVGLIWVDNARLEEAAGFPPRKIAPEVDFLAVHVYPERGKVNVALDSLAGYRIGKPIVVEETFPLKCSPMELGDFIQRSRDVAGRLMLGWLNLFQSLNPNR